MRFWISKNSELPIHEQLVRQVLLGILSEDLPAGHKLPSVRAVARRHRIHSNTVSAAYHDLLDRGWLELRRGSGLYVCPLNPSGQGPGELDSLLAAVLQNAGRRGYEPEEVLRRLEHMIRPVSYERVVIAEPEAAMREILKAEIGEHLQVPVEALETLAGGEVWEGGRSLVVALPTRVTKIRHQLPRGVPCIGLRLRSVRGSLEGQTKPGTDTVVAIVSGSAEIRYWSRAMLIAVGLAPECLCEIDATMAGWQERVARGAFVVTDVVSVRELPAGCQAKVFRVIADSSLAELKQFCGG